MADFSQFSLEGKTAVLIGGGGAIGMAVARGLATIGAHAVVCDVTQEKAAQGADRLKADGLSASGQAVDALSKESLVACRDTVIAEHGTVDILVNLVGGNLPEASTTDGRTFFDLPTEAFDKAIAINLFGGAILPTQAFLECMVENPDGGAVINTASMNAIRPLTRIPGYSAGKAAVANFTQWLAVHVAQEYTPKVRVNAIAPGFFVTDQNRYLLYDKDTGGLTDRGQTVVDHTPIVVPIDGGFSAFSGV
jgi:NAD(P)-dependent dehydrogenase (short-subunit alcohol dehydrogenase family)